MSSETAQYQKLIRPIARLALFLVGVPFLVTFLHFRRYTHTSRFCFLDFVADESSEKDFSTPDDETARLRRLSGVYRRRDAKFYRVRSPSEKGIRNYGWPSAHVVSSNLALLRSKSKAPASNPSLEYDSEKDAWCAVDDEFAVRACSSGRGTNPLEPPSGVWANSWSRAGGAESVSRGTLVSSCPSSSAFARFASPPGKKKTRRTENLEQILDRPATSFLLALNVFLAFSYWNKRTSPQAVAKIFSQIVPSPPHELWRAFSGACAHFEIFHLGFNMMTLYSVGNSLEETFGSVSFLFYNFSLCILTTACMMLVFYVKIKGGAQEAANSASVGYSGVLFAWIVVQTMALPKTCPVPFLKDLCFDTYSLPGGFKFNVSPLIQLAMCQFIMRRVSFWGHLAGIVCGFLLHWGILPIALVAPHLLISAVFLAHLLLVQKVLHKPDDTPWSLDSQALEDHENPSRPTEKSKMLACLDRTKRMAVVVGLLSLSLDFGMIASFSLSWFLFYLATRSFRNSGTNANASGIVLRWYVVSAILLVVVDAMTLAAWCATRTYVVMDRLLLVNFWSSVAIVLLRVLLNSAGLVFVNKILKDTGEMKSGIFSNVLGYFLTDFNSIGQSLMKPVVIAFEGKGFALGVFGNETVPT